jgi:hypothetical protein
MGRGYSDTIRSIVLGMALGEWRIRQEAEILD